VRARSPRVAVLFLLLCVSGSAAVADDVTGFVELSATCSTSESEIVGLPRIETDSTSYRQQANFVWTRKIYPNFQAQAGGYFERFDDAIEQFGFDRDSERTRLRPFVRLTVRSPLTLGEIGWDRNEETSRTDTLARQSLTRDTFLGIAGWNPVDLPSVRLELSHIDDRDGNRAIVDRNERALRLTSEYRDIETLRLYYRGALEHVEDRIEGTSLRNTIHNGQASWGDAFFDQRWELDASWSTSYRNTRVESAGTGELLIPVLPVGGLSALDDTPNEGILDPAPLLADGNTLVGTAVNLGLVPAAGDDRPRNFGVDLGIARDVNLLRVWVDRELPFEISSTFSWEVWTSDDAQFWARAAVVPTAPFGPFDNRFELRFPGILARWIKVVVRPLSPTVPDAVSYPTILVTEFEPYSAVSAEEFEEEFSDTRNLAQAGSRFRILDRPALYYETTYYMVSSSGGPTSWALSNGLSVQHQFDPVWGISARVSREDGLERDRERTAHLYSAALTSVPLERLRHSLVLSGYVDETGGTETDNHSVVLNSTALVYDGIDLTLVLGKSHATISDGSSNDAELIGAGATLTPYRTVTFNLRYDERDATIAVEGVPDRPELTRSAEASVAYTPVPSVYFFASRRQDERTNEADRVTDTFALSWSPFPGGALQVSVSYDETRYSDLDEVNTSFVPFLRWNINARSYLEITYQNLQRESNLAVLDDEIATATLRLGF
jgi:hypothetical protein